MSRGNDPYYNTDISTSVRIATGKRLFRISKRNGVPYITFRRKTRVLFQNPVGGAFITIDGTRYYFV